MPDLTNKEILDQLGVEAAPKKQATRSPREARVIAGFEEIQQFAEEHGHPPLHGEDRDIFERLNAVRLDRLRAQEDCRALLSDLDTQGLLDDTDTPQPGFSEDIDDKELLAELGIEPATDGDSITQLRHVKTRAEIRAAEEIANRTVCEDFDTFRPLFEQVQAELDAGVRETRPFGKDAKIRQGEFFIVGGQTAYVADLGQDFVTDYDRRDSRLRVIYDNGTESDILLRSLQRALYKDEAGRRITDAAAGPLFVTDTDDAGTESGTIYVLRSKSDHPYIVQNQEILHKIGVTGSSVEQRIANAQTQATFLLADVEIVASYKLFNINRAKLENLLHRFFAAARLDLEIEDRFGRPVRPREWFLVPLAVIDEVVGLIQDRSITKAVYDPASASIIRSG